MWHKPKLLNWTATFFFVVAGLLAVFILLYMLVHSSLFPLRQVKVEGQLSHITHDQVRFIVQKHLKGNFFTLNLSRTRDAFEKLPWVRKVAIHRRWPDKIEVAIEEHQALARWGDLALVNTYGEMFHGASSASLPVFYGPGDAVAEVTQGYKDFSQILAPAAIKVRQLTLSPRRAWKITSDKGMRIALGRVDMHNRLNKFAKSYIKTISKLHVNVEYADLRYPNGFAMRKPS